MLEVAEVPPEALAPLTVVPLLATVACNPKYGCTRPGTTQTDCVIRAVIPLVQVRIYAEHAAAASLPSDRANDLSGRPRTGASALWTLPPTPTAGALLFSPDVSDLVREVARGLRASAGWPG